MFKGFKGSGDGWVGKTFIFGQGQQRRNIVSNHFAYLVEPSP